jgi:hypothetical protein
METGAASLRHADQASSIGGVDRCDRHRIGCSEAGNGEYGGRK